MDTQEILNKITPIFCKVFNDDELDVTANLTSDEIDEWSSLTQAIMLTEIENTFDIKFKLREVATMNSVQAIIDAISAKINA